MRSRWLPWVVAAAFVVLASALTRDRAASGRGGASAEPPE